MLFVLYTFIVSLVMRVGVHLSAQIVVREIGAHLLVQLAGCRSDVSFTVFGVYVVARKFFGGRRGQ